MAPKISFLQLASSGGGRFRGGSRLKHPIFAWLGLRPVHAQHTRAEHEALSRAAWGRRYLVEIGVAEGASAMALRESMAPDGSLVLIDPFHQSRFRQFNALRRAARRAVGLSCRGKVRWIQKFSYEVAPSWKEPIDVLLIDGDHAEQEVWRDWNDWHRFVVRGGVVLFHDARMFEGGWTTPDYGPVRVVDRLFRNEAPSQWRILEEVDSLVIVQREA